MHGNGERETEFIITMNFRYWKFKDSFSENIFISVLFIECHTIS